MEEDKMEKDKDMIVHRRRKFDNALLHYKGPSIIPTIFINHEDRFEYIRDRDRQNRVRTKRHPPQEPFYIFTFADDVYSNICSNIKENTAYIKGNKFAYPIFLNKDVCGEEVFVDMLSQKPTLYSDKLEVLQKDRYSDKNSFEPSVQNCTNTCEFIADFSVIFPEGTVSTVYVICYECGRLLETILSDNVVDAAKKEMLHNIAHLNLCGKDEEPIKSVIRLPMRGTCIRDCPFIEGLIGVTTLTKHNPLNPSIFMRTRLYFFCNPRSMINRVIHN